MNNANLAIGTQAFRKYYDCLSVIFWQSIFKGWNNLLFQTTRRDLFKGFAPDFIG